MAHKIPESVHYRDEPMGLHKHYLQSCFVDSTLVYQRVIILIHSAIDHIFKKKIAVAMPHTCSANC